MIPSFRRPNKMSNCTMKTYDFHYSVHEVDGKEFELIECSTWPRLNVQVIHTTPERFEDDLKVIKSRLKAVLFAVILPMIKPLFSSMQVEKATAN